MEIKYLQVLVMPNTEILCEGKTIGYSKNLGKYLRDLDQMERFIKDQRDIENNRKALENIITN